MVVVENPLEASDILNNDLTKITRWAGTWLVSFNAAKTNSLLMSLKKIKPYHPPLYMQDQQITEVDSHKHLGIYFSSDCSWHRHINYIKEKAWARINVMRKLKFKLDRKSLETIYLTFIRPIIEYGDVLWDNCTQYEKDDLEKIQIEAARIAIGATKLISLNALFREIQWESLEQRRHKHQLTMFYKMSNDLTPGYLTSLVPQPVGAASRYSLRNANNLQTIKCRTNLYYESFLPSAVRSWNALPTEVQQSDSVNTFKRRITTKQPTPKYYYVGSRRAQILHTRLRTNCSGLNIDLFTRNISDSPLCSCGSIEDAQHFFFHCRYYTAQRDILLNATREYTLPSLNCFLYGNSLLSFESNSNIFKHVQKYIIDTNRF